MNGELHILDGNALYKHSVNKSFLTKLGFRLLFKKITLDEQTWMKGRCLSCDARGDSNYAISCMVFYCPCKHNENLKLK